jgi:hypothetical protein
MLGDRTVDPPRIRSDVGDDATDPNVTFEPLGHRRARRERRRRQAASADLHL